MERRETIIALSRTIDRLREQVADAEATLEQRRQQLAAAIREMDQMLEAPAPPVDQGLASYELGRMLSADWNTVASEAKAHWVRMLAKPSDSKVRWRLTADQTRPELIKQIVPKPDVGEPDSNTPAVEDGSITAQIRTMFEANPFTAFTTPEVMDCLHLPKGKEGAVRQALRRLFELGVLMKQDRGTYQLNPLQKELTGSERNG